jgi:hypothetical protein
MRNNQKREFEIKLKKGTTLPHDYDSRIEERSQVKPERNLSEFY